jgi:predicted alpha/beta superfamily hydrolase
MNLQPQHAAEVTLPNTEVQRLASSIVGDSFQLHIVLPAGYERTSRRYPIVYLTDGNAVFPLAGAIVEGLSGGLEIPRLIVVGIGYDDARPREWGRYRERDLLPTDAAAADASRRQAFTRRGIRRGQAAAFLEFIREELKPFIAANYRADPEDSAFVGHSYGGLFGLYTLFHRPDTFNRYIISSPAVHHDDRVIMDFENDYATDHDDLPARVFISVGGREEHDDPLIDPSLHFESNVKLLANRLADRGYPALRLTTHIFEGESHLSVMPAAISRGLRAVFE